MGEPTDSAGADASATAVSDAEVSLPAVLAVDDDEQMRNAVRRTLQKEFRVDLAAGAEEALAALGGTVAHAAVVCDLTMPGVGGLQLLQMIRTRRPDLPVIILTGQGSLASAIEVMQYGGFRYLTKPFEPETLREAVRSAAAYQQLETLRRRAVEMCALGTWQQANRPELDGHFDEALRGVWMAYQPIIDWGTQTVYGYEALVRSRGPQLTNPGLLFEAAERLGRVQEVGRTVRSLVAGAVERAPQDAAIFVNLHTLDLGDDDLYAPSAPLSRHAHRVVLEITERMSLDAIVDLDEKLHKLRQLGYRIAVDDLGAGYAGLSSFAQLSPDIAKLDMSLIRGVDSTPRKASIVRSMLQVCRGDLDTLVVCEGVETVGERDVLLGLGADLLQGYLFARPSPTFDLAQFGIR